MRKSSLVIAAALAGAELWNHRDNEEYWPRDGYIHRIHNAKRRKEERESDEDDGNRENLMMGAFAHIRTHTVRRDYG